MHYALDAASLLQASLQRLRETIALGADTALLDLEDALWTIERLLHAHFVQIIELERQAIVEDGYYDIDLESLESIPSGLQESVHALMDVMEYRKSHRRQQQPQRPRSIPEQLDKLDTIGVTTGGASSSEQRAGDTTAAVTPYNNRSATDSILFRLIVTLQLCLLRINDVHSVFGGNRSKTSRLPLIAAAAVACVGTVVLRPNLVRQHQRAHLGTLAKASVSAISVGIVYKVLLRLWTVGKLAKSTVMLENWRDQWMEMQRVASSPSSAREAKMRTQKLIEIAKNQSPKMSFWQSEGELRFLVLKRAMDLLYASVGTAIEVTKPNRPTMEGPSWQTSLTAMAAASYLSLIGPNKRAAQAVSESSSDLIQNAWGMVSLPAIKQLSLRATRLLKGAALAERITLAGVPCFILSKDPVPDVVISLKRYARQQQRRSMTSRLSTIDERTTEVPSHRRQRSTSVTLKSRHVILHLTGGGFFAHTLASDLPYLLDWSKKTGAVVICPEYSLLPENIFPIALDQASKVYSSLVGGKASLKLGFEVGRVAVTGESAGGNLAAALCVKLGMTVDPQSLVRDRSGEYGGQESPTIRLPDALMLSCPALNLSLELSPSRVIGDQDPVLPSGLISAISDAYVPAGLSKQDPLVSPLYAPDDILRHFPPTLLFASSDDPLLDDSVHFNTRLRCLGVESDLRATHHMPHAYWGLGTAGFPEAQQVQVECEEFLQHQLTREDKY